MKIGSGRSVVNLEAYIRNARNSAGVKPPPTQEQDKSIQQTERVKLSTTAKELKRAREVVEATPEIREDKVEQFKKEIEAGTYKVKGYEVAGKMLRESLIDTFA